MKYGNISPTRKHLETQIGLGIVVNALKFIVDLDNHVKEVCVMDINERFR